MSIFLGRKAIAASIMLPGLLAAVSPTQAALEEVVVTAQKRAESANDIGLSISVLSSNTMDMQKLTTLEEITTAVPGLVFSTSQQGTPILTLRGVGFNESSLGVYPATSLYVDEVPLPFPVMAAHSAFDLERAEVLKGPQGVLFGQNSTGGAINFIAAKPEDELSYGGDISYGRFNRAEVNGFVTNSLSDNVSARLSIQAVQSDDWQESNTSNREIGEEDYYAGRLQLRYRPNEAAEININFNGWKDKTDPVAMQFVAATPKRFDEAPDQALAQAAVPFTDDDARSADWSVSQNSDREFYQASVRGDFDINDDMTLTGLLAYSDYDQNKSHDGDGSNLATADFLKADGDIDSTFAELRLAGNSDLMRWILGVNYENSNTSEDQLLDILDNTSNRPQTLQVHSVGSALDQDIESYAVFGNIDVNLTDDLTGKLGARYTDTQIDADSCNYAPPNLDPDLDRSNGIGSNAAALFNLLGDVTGTVPFTPIGIGGCFTLNENNVPGIPYLDTLDEDNVSWRVGLDYQLNTETLVYANISQGYKAGSFPVLAANSYDQLLPVTEESVLAYEVGFKALLMNDTLQWNAAIFYYDYEDKQVRGKINTAIFGPLDRLVNVPDSTIQGIETDLVVQLSEGLTLTAAATYIDSEIDNYFGYNVYGGEGDLSGNDIPFTPDWTYSLDLDYRKPFKNGEFFAGVNVNGQSDSDAVIGASDLDLGDFPLPGGVEGGYQKSITDNYFVVESYTTVGARIGYQSTDGNWRVMLWGKNITDEYYWNNVIASSESGARVAGSPRTYGVTLGYKY